MVRPMTDPVLPALYTLTALLMAAFLGLVWELWRGYRARRPVQVWTHHRWTVELLNDKVAWFSCERCGAVAVRASE